LAGHTECGRRGRALRTLKRLRSASRTQQTPAPTWHSRHPSHSLENESDRHTSHDTNAELPNGCPEIQVVPENHSAFLVCIKTA
jgi:hypothetical protein